MITRHVARELVPLMVIILASSAMPAAGGQESTEELESQEEATSAEETEEPAVEEDEKVVSPWPWDKKKFAVVVGYSGSTVDVDVDRDGDDKLTFDGWGVSGRIALSKRWGIQFGYRNMDDDEHLDSGGSLSLDMIVVDSYFFWLKTDHTRWHVKAGLTWTDFEEKIPSVGTSSDQALGPSIGTGFEWGSARYAFFVDFGVTWVDIELIPGKEESFIVGNTLTGFSFKF
jgi:hypothetical protein